MIDERRRAAEDALGVASASSPLGVVESLERELQTAACRSDPARLRELLSPDFEEIGASGRVWDAPAIIAHVAAETDVSEPIVMRDVSARAVGADAVLVRWTSSRAEKRALRTSLWQREEGSWRLVHHQATPLP